MNRNDPSAVARRLVAVANELLATAYELSGRRGADRSENHTLAGSGAASADDPLWLVVARQAYRDRRRREDIFGGDLFGEPAWDILLDLFVAAKQGKRISITSACIGAAAPSTTALRWLNILEREGLIEREGDSNDMRRSYVRLTADGYAKMIEYFVDGSLAAASDRDPARARPDERDSHPPRSAGLPPRPAHPD